MILLIGGSGFIGSNLIRILGKENCYNLDKVPSPLYNEITFLHDIRVPLQLDFKKKIQCAILLAAEHKDDVSPSDLYYDVNVQGTLNVLEKLDELGIVNLIFTSTVAIYGLNKVHPDEEYIPDPFNDYGKSKLLAEKLIKEWFLKSPECKSVTIVRPTVVFGENNRGNVYNLIKQLSDKRFIMIGNGNNRKSLAYVGNLAAFIKHRIDNSTPGIHIFNYADNPDFSMKILTMKISDYLQVNQPRLSIPYILGLLSGILFDLLSFILRRKLPISYVRVKKFCANTQYNSTKAHNEFKAPFSIEEGLKRTINNDFPFTK